MSPAKIGTKPAATPRTTEAGKAKEASPAANDSKKPSPGLASKANDGFRPTAQPVTRPSPIRDPGELGAAWRAVNMSEHYPDYNGANPGSVIGSLNETSTQYWPHVNQDFKNQVSGDLKNFLRLGNSSLTRYETNQLTRGLFGANVNYHGYGDAEKYQIGDRVEFATKDAQGKSVTQRGIFYGSGVLTAAEGKFEMIELANPNGERPAVISRIIASALVDGRY
jgi:hypothetical protein